MIKRFLLLILVILNAAIAFAQRGDIQKVATIIELKTYNGTAPYVFVSENSSLYTTCSGCIADEVYVYAGTRGQKWTRCSINPDSIATKAEVREKPDTAWVNTKLLDYALTSAISGKQDQLNGTGFVKASGNTITYDNNSYSLSTHDHDGRYYTQSSTDGFLANKVDKNSNITGATKTKITYDAKGLVTAGADATTSDISEGANLYYTNARVNSQLNTYTGDVTFSSGVSAIGASKVTNSMLAGSIAASKLIGTDITTVGSISTGIWQATAIADAYISSAATWNAKQSQLNGTGFIKANGTTITYDNNTYSLANHTHNASAITAGTLDVARLPTNTALLDATSSVFTGDIYSPNIGIGITSGLGAKLHIVNNSALSNSISFWASGTNTASSGISTTFAFTPTYNQSGGAGGNVIFISPRYQNTGSGDYYLFRAGTNTGDNASGVHTDKATIDKDGNQQLAGTLSTPTVVLSKQSAIPSSNTDSSAKVFNHLFAGRAMPGVSGIGAVYEFQPAIFTKKISWFVPTGNSSGVINIGINAIGSTGSQPVTTTFSGNLFQSARRITYESAATSGAVAGIRHNSLQWARGNADNKAGIFFVMKGGVANASVISDLRWFVGFNGSTAQMTNADPSSNTNIFGFGKDAADANVQFIYNDGSGTASKIDLGSNFPANTNSTDWYQFTIYAPTNSSAVYYHLKRINTGDEITGMVSTDLPSQTQGLEYEVFINNNATALAARFDVGNIYIESEN